MTHDDYYARVAHAFDRAAASYGADYVANPIMAWLEDDTFAQLCRLFPPGSRLLEIGCGTGDMALRLAGAGREVVATDISPAMIAQAQSAAASHPAVRSGHLARRACGRDRRHRPSSLGACSAPDSTAHTATSGH